MPTRFESDLREHLQRETARVPVFPHGLSRRIRDATEPKIGFGIMPQLAMACGLLLFAGVLAYGVAEIRGGSAPRVGGSPSPTPVATSTAMPTRSPSPSPSAQDLGPFSCSDRAGGDAMALSQLTAVRVAHHPGYDRITFEFAGALPRYTLVRQTTAHFVRDASGQPVTLNGTAGLKLTFQGVDLSAAVPADQTPSLPVVTVVQNIGNFERVVSYGVGLASPACLRVLELKGPTRLVVDIQAPPAAG